MGWKLPPDVERKARELAGELPPHPDEPKSSKYHNQKVQIGDLKFDSKREANRWYVLTLAEAAGQISDLRRQVGFDIVINGVKVCVYRADFTYIENGKAVIEDAKGLKTDVYRLKKKLMKAVYGIDILET